MTKRMLSLLLALVMTLSLCVPALAADEFEAETVTEVEEQAPEAPAEPEAPEAEVVEEPVVEEAVEAPKIAMAIAEEPEDEPVTIAVGEISKAAVDMLNDALEKVKPYKDKIDAGEMYVQPENFSYANVSKLNDGFATDYAEAQRCLKGINGEETGKDVTDSGVRKIAEKLLDYIPADPKNPGNNEFNSVPTKAMNLAISPIHNSSSDDDGKLAANLLGSDSAQFESKNLTVEAIDTTDIDTVTQKDQLLVEKHSDAYIAAVKAAITAATEYTKKADSKKTYAEYAKVVALIKTATDLVTSTSDTFSEKLTSAEAKALYDAIVAVEEAAKKDGFTTTYVDANSVKTKADEVKSSLLEADFVAAKGSWNKPGTGFKTGADYAKYKAAMESLKLVEIDRKVTVSIEAGEKQNGAIKTLTVKVTKDENNTGIKYYYNFDVNGKTFFDGKASQAAFKSAEDSAATLAGEIKANNTAAGVTTDFTSDDKGHEVATLTLNPLWLNEKNEPAVSAFSSSDTINVRIYKDGEYGGFEKVTEGKFDVPEDGYVGPTIAVYKDTDTLPEGKKVGDQKITVTYDTKKSSKSAASGINTTKDPFTTDWYKSTDQTEGGPIFIEIAIDGFSAYYTDYKLVVRGMGANGADLVIAKSEQGANSSSLKSGFDSTTAASVTKAYIALNATQEAQIKNGKIEVELWVKNGGTDDEPVAHGAATKATITLDTLDTWDDEGLSAAIEAYDSLKKDDFPKKTTGGTYELDAAWTGFQNALTAAKAIESAVSSKVNSSAERKASNDAIVNMDAWMKEMTLKTPDLVPLKKAIEQTYAVLKEAFTGTTWASSTMTSAYASTLGAQPENHEVYTVKSYSALSDAYKDAIGQLASSPSSTAGAATGATETSVKAATKALTDALAALVSLDESVNKAALNTAIAEAEGLKKEDYTEDTWKAVETALAEAKTVAAKADATQTEVDAAAKKLNDAIDALVKTGDKDALQAAIDAAKKLSKDDYTEDSWKAADLATAIATAEEVVKNEKATDAQIDAALAGLKAAEDALVKKTETPTIPAAPANGTGWSHASDGTWYYYKDKALQKSKWIYGKGGLWYYVDEAGKMLTGFHKIGGAWFMLQTGTEGGVQGKLLSGWINDPAIPGSDAYARTDRNSGHFGEITWTAANGDFVNGHFTKGDPAA